MNEQECLLQAQQALQAGQPEQALHTIQQALQQQPESETLRFWQAVLLQQTGKTRSALQNLQTLLQENSTADWLRAGLQMVLSLPEAVWLQQAEAWGRWLLARADATPIDAYMQACVLARLQRHQAAEQGFRAVLQQQPHMTQAHYELALCLHRQQRETEALQHFAACGPLEAQQPWFHFNHALSLQGAGDMEAAIAALRQALQLQPDLLDARLRLAELLAREACWEPLQHEKKIIIEQLQACQKALHTSPYAADVVQLPHACQHQLACDWSAQASRGIAPLAAARTTAKRPLRVAYFGGDLNHSAAGTLLAAILPHHEAAQVEVFALSTHVTGDATEARIRAACRRWEDLSTLDDAQAAERISRLQVDVLLDVSGYTRRGRPGVLARRPVARQLAMLGYLNRHCAPFLDAIVADDFCAAGLPADWDEALLCHPLSLLPPELGLPLQQAPGRDALELPHTARVLASFNAVYKLHPQLLQLWAGILQADPDSVLWLGGAGSERAWRRVEQFLQAHKVEASRIIRAENLPLEAHVERLQQADLWLDTFPYNGGASVVAARTASLPVLTLAGTGLMGRMSASLNHACAMQALVAEDTEQYRELALRPPPIQGDAPTLHGWTAAFERQLQRYCSE